MDGIRRYAGIDWAKDAPRGLRHRRAGRRGGPLRGRAHATPGCGSSSAGSGASRAWPSSDRTARSSTPCSRPACRWSSSPAATSRRCAPATAWPATRTTAPTRSSSPTPCAPTATGCGRCSPDAPETVALRATVRARKDLVRTPGARSSSSWRRTWRSSSPVRSDLFDDLASPIAQAFLLRFPSAERAAWLEPAADRRAWLAAQGYCGRRTGAELHARLVAAPAGVTGESRRGDGRRDPRPRRGRSAAIDEQVEALEARIAEQLALHPDGAHLHEPAARRAASGRRRCWPRSATAGSASRRPSRSPAWPGRRPSTRQSGQHRAVTFRYACDKKLRDALVDFAAGQPPCQPLGRGPLPPGA